MKKVRYYSLPLFGNQFKGKCTGFAQLSAMFQIWARQYGLSDQDSLILWYAGSGRESIAGVGQEEDVYNKAIFLIDKLPKAKAIVSLTEL